MIQNLRTMKASVKATLGKTNFYTEIVAGENKIITDEPVSLGGQNKGFNPLEVLASSLASCTAATLKIFMDRKEWEVESIEIDVDIENNATERQAVFTRKIHFNGNLDEKQIERLHKVAESCPIHKLLTNQIEIQTEIV